MRINIILICIIGMNISNYIYRSPEQGDTLRSRMSSKHNNLQVWV